MTAAEHLEDDGLLVATVAACRVTAMDGSVLRIRDAWGSRPVVHVFLRQFGCLFCHETVAVMIQATPRIAALGAHVVMVGCGTPDQAAKFAKDKRLPRIGVSLYTDSTRASFEAASLERSWRRTFWHGGARTAYGRARTGGHLITGVQGDVAQLGGVMVVHPPARLTFLHRSRFAGDNPDGDRILAAVTSEAPSLPPPEPAP